jgi:hypothetical protein
MELINRILVVSWLSRHCDETIKIGISLAQKYKAEISVVHIIDDMDKWTGLSRSQPRRRAKKRQGSISSKTA